MCVSVTFKELKHKRFQRGVTFKELKHKRYQRGVKLVST